MRIANPAIASLLCSTDHRVLLFLITLCSELIDDAFHLPHLPAVLCAFVDFDLVGVWCDAS